MKTNQNNRYKAEPLQLSNIEIRSQLQPGDLGYIIYLHGKLYKEEYDYGLAFEMYVAHGLYEFYKNFNPQLDGIWMAEHKGTIVGSLVLMHRENNAAQLRYFLIHPAYRGMGLGKKLMELYMAFLKKCNYRSAYLWTTHEQQTAAALYKSYGFKLTEEMPSDSFGKPLTEQRYDLVL